MQVAQHVAVRVAAYPHLAARRAKLQHHDDNVSLRFLKLDRVESTRSCLHARIRHRLWWAALRWLAHAQASRTTPPGLEDIAMLADGFNESYASPSGAKLCAQYTLDGRLLLPLFDQMLCAYDAQRESIWPSTDMLLQHTLHAVKNRLPMDDGAGQRKGRESEAREECKELLAWQSAALAATLPELLLSALDPGWVTSWQLDVKAAQVCIAVLLTWPCACTLVLAASQCCMIEVSCMCASAQSPVLLCPKAAEQQSERTISSAVWKDLQHLVKLMLGRKRAGAGQCPGGAGPLS